MMKQIYLWAAILGNGREDGMQVSHPSATVRQANIHISICTSYSIVSKTNVSYDR